MGGVWGWVNLGGSRNGEMRLVSRREGAVVLSERGEDAPARAGGCAGSGARMRLLAGVGVV